MNNLQKRALFSIGIFLLLLGLLPLLDGFVLTAAAQSGGGDLGGIELPTGTGLSELSILEILVTVLQWLIEVFLILAVIAFVITGIQFIMAMGNAYSSSASNAKSNFTNSIIALVVVGAAYIIITTIQKLLAGGA